MAALPVEVLLGIYLGLLTGIIPALVAWSFGFLFKYFTGVSVPALAVVVLGVAIAGANGGLLALVDPTITKLPNSERVVVAIIVVMMMTLYAHSQGDKLGAEFPHRLTLKGLRKRTLSTDVIEIVGGRGQVHVSPAGDIDDIEGYLPLDRATRAAIKADEWTFPADIPLAEIELRLEDRLRTAYDLAEVEVELDERGRAQIAAALGTHGVSERVPAGMRAVSIETLVPTGLARGDEVTVILDGGTVTGTVVSARSDFAQSTEPEPVPAKPVADETDGSSAPSPTGPAPSTTSGGDGRITLAVPRGSVEELLQAKRGRVMVRSKGTRGEFRLLGLLRRAGARLRKLTVQAGSQLTGTTLATAAVRATYGIEVLAVRDDGHWSITPPGETTLEGGNDVFVVGTADAVDRFEEAVK